MNSLLVVAIFAVKALGSRLSPGFSGPGTDTQALLSQDWHDPFRLSYGRLVNEKTSLTLLYQNNLNASDDENHVGAILLDPLGQYDIRDECEEIGESMIPLSTILEYKQDFLNLFSYFFFSTGQTEEDACARFYIQNGMLTVNKNDKHFDHSPFPSRDVQLPVLCTQTSTAFEKHRERDPARKLVRVRSEGNTYIGSRDQKSFRFLGIPYADPPIRFSYPKPYTGKSRTIYATDHGPDCSQTDGGSENCLYLNVQTPYIPKMNSTKGLRPVLFWIHGGDFTSGAGSSSVTEGGNLASREDIVVVTFNYRLSTLGFLAVPGTDIRGNYGVADQVLALEWTIKNIAQFGGDPQQITIMGEAAGASSVKALLGSPYGVRKFQGAIAISDLGGVKPDSSGTPYGSYLSIPEFHRTVGQNIFSEAGCNEGTIEQQVSCLREIPASTLVTLPTVAHHIVQDGKYINTAQLNLLGRPVGAPKVPVMFGSTANEGASFATYPSSTIQSLLEGINESLGISTTQSQRILDSGLFPSPNTGNITLDSFNISQRIATDLYTRCPSQAALFAGVSNGVFRTAYYYQFQRTIGGHDPNSHNLGTPPPTSDFPLGDPDLPYFQLHGGTLPFIFGNLPAIRNSLDLHAALLISAYFAAFIRTGQPNPDMEFLAARGYTATMEAVSAFDTWEPVRNASGPIHVLDFPSETAPFQDLEQCEFLGWPITHFVDADDNTI
ncbi:putative carboxylesterase [Aspergillus lucknowensis]|uniref:Alpha/Beta hydrolase protein n=1 Tax=Aspergillus lucknowensis TaxID=176173 RepID=A0ABR4LMV6_9EURO